jgi:hypothetical protein
MGDGCPVEQPADGKVLAVWRLACLQPHAALGRMNETAETAPAPYLVDAGAADPN